MSKLFFKQIKQWSDNFSYVIGDDVIKEAAIIDPSFNAETIIQLLAQQGFKAKYVINTHGHMDHASGNEKIRSTLGAKVVAHKLSRVKKDISVDEGDIIKIGNVTAKIISTPGHTSDSICLLVDGKLLTGDTLFVGECGRTDLPDGNSGDMYHSLFDKLLKLNDDVEVYPGHDYGLSPHSTIGRERRTNYTLEKRSLEEFVEFMSQP